MKLPDIEALANLKKSGGGSKPSSAPGSPAPSKSQSAAASPAPPPVQQEDGNAVPTAADKSSEKQ